MAAAVVDVDYLSAYLDISQQTISQTIDAPTTELVQAVLIAISIKAREHDELVADKLRLEIELENAVRSSETRIEGLKASVEKAQKTVEEVRTQLNNEGNARSLLESELQTLKSTSTTSTSEVETLRNRISSLESANRDTIALLEAKTTANDSLAQDLQKQHQKGLQLSQQITSLQQTVQNANSAASSAKFREQSLKQEVELAKRNSEWFENELKTKNAESVKYRKEKSARIAELQRLNEDANSTLEAMKRTEQILRGRLDEMQKKAEDSLAKVQQLQEAAAKTEEGFRQELESSRRLAELQAQQSETHRNRLREVEAGLERVKDEAAEEVGRSRQDAEIERQEREHAEQRIVELEAEVDRLEATIAAPRPGSIPGTPRAGLNGSMLGRSGSPAPFGTPGSVRSKSAITATQAIDELYKVKAQLATEKRRGDRLAAEMEEMMQGLEAKQPEIEELQNEYTRIQQELVDMSKFVDQTNKEKERARKDTRKAESEASTALAETKILQQQLRDLSAQVKLLLFDIDARERGLEALTPVERSQLDRLVRGEISEGALDGMTDTDRLISERLTVFRSIGELQEKNQELLKITRQLGAQMESEEALAAKNQAAKDHAEVKELQVKIENYKDELNSVIIRSESYVKERDMFRRMLQHRGQIPADADITSLFGQSVDGTQNGIGNTNEHGKDNANYATLLRELQAHFDQYREEQSIDRRTMKEQTERLSVEKSSLQAEVAKLSSQLTHAAERYEMLHANFSMLQNENGELQKRSQVLSEAAAKQDVKTQQVAEDLIEAKGLAESMRNENANLKAEKKLWKDIQDRLNQDNENLMTERTRLNNLVASQQTLQNERELSEAETRRHLQAQVESLEGELSSTKRKLSDEVEESKKAQLRKEYDSQQTQKRIDDLAASLSQAREELVAAKTTRDHLQSRVDDLTIELKSAEERVELLQPRPTPRPGTDSRAAAVNGDGPEDDGLTKEQELAIELSELKRDLELAKSELENAKNQMEQYKAISQASEEELQSLNTTQDQYREEMDRILAEKDSKIRELEQRADDIASELGRTNNELTALRNQQGEANRRIEEERVILESEISRLKDEDERHATAARFHQQDLRAQAAIATKAQQDYENELVKHAEAAKLLQNLRTEHNQLKSETASLRADAESARVALSQSESSWEDRREQFELEIKELKSRRDDANAQNKLLHQQLENVNSQIAALQQSRSDGPRQDSVGLEGGDKNADGLRELNSFLRREKEILEVQYELKVQEAKRLQQQLEYTHSQLDETRLKLEQERQLHASSGQSNLTHQDLMEKLNELNLFRESSITLRNETRQAQALLVEKTTRVEELLAQIQPLETRIRELEHNKETLDGEMQLLQADRDRWQKRTQDIISKYDRIDPAEMELLKETITNLQTERDNLTQAQQPLQEKVDGFEAERASWQSSRQKIVEQAKEKNRLNAKEIKDRTAERDAALQDKDNLQQELGKLQQKLEIAVHEKESVEQQVASINQELATTRVERDQTVSTALQPPAHDAPALVASEVHGSNEVHLQTLQQQLEEVATVRQHLESEKQALDIKVQSLEEQLRLAQSERDAALADASEARAKLESLQANNEPSSEPEEGQISDAPRTEITDDERQALERRVAEAEDRAKESEDKAQKLEADMEATIKARSEKMKAALNKRLVESREAQKVEIRAELEADYNLRLEQERKILAAELQAAIPKPANAANSQANSQVTEPHAETIPVTPTTIDKQQQGANPLDASSWTDGQVREFLSTNATVKSILMSNVKKKIEIEVEKVKQEHEKAITEKLVEAQQKAETAKTQAVALETKKSTLKLSMLENRAKLANAKLEIVSTAAKDAPQKPVVEVWEIVSHFKLPATAASTLPSLPVASNASIKTETPKIANGTSQTVANSNEGVAEPSGNTTAAPSQIPQPQVQSGVPSGLPVPSSNIPGASQPANSGGRPSGIPMARGGGPPHRGRGAPGQIYQRGAAQGGRGRGGGQRQSLNADAPAFSPGGATGVKRPREEGAAAPHQSNAGKRPRGGGQQS